MRHPQKFALFAGGFAVALCMAICTWVIALINMVSVAREGREMIGELPAFVRSFVTPLSGPIICLVLIAVWVVLLRHEEQSSKRLSGMIESIAKLDLSDGPLYWLCVITITNNDAPTIVNGFRIEIQLGKQRVSAGPRTDVPIFTLPNGTAYVVDQRDLLYHKISGTIPTGELRTGVLCFAIAPEVKHAIDSKTKCRLIFSDSRRRQHSTDWTLTEVGDSRPRFYPGLNQGLPSA